MIAKKNKKKTREDRSSKSKRSGVGSPTGMDESAEKTSHAFSSSNVGTHRDYTDKKPSGLSIYNTNTGRSNELNLNTNPL